MEPTKANSDYPDIVLALLSKFQEKAYLPPETQRLVAECLTQVINEETQGTGTDSASEEVLSKISPEAAPKYVDAVMSHLNRTLSWDVRERFEEVLVAVITAAFEDAAAKDTFDSEDVLASMSMAIQQVVAQEGIDADDLELVLVSIRQALQKVSQIINAVHGE